MTSPLTDNLYTAGSVAIYRKHSPEKHIQDDPGRVKRQDASKDRKKECPAAGSGRTV